MGAENRSGCLPFYCLLCTARQNNRRASDINKPAPTSSHPTVLLRVCTRPIQSPRIVDAQLTRSGAREDLAPRSRWQNNIEALHP
jgi:hypothetical protein